MGFNFPVPPDTAFPLPAQHVTNLVMLLLVVAAIGYALSEWRLGRGPLALLLVGGGAVSYLNEPILDVLGLCWHPRSGQDVAITTFGPAPLWGLGVYTVFFGAGTYLLYRLLGLGTTRRRFWLGALGFFVVNLAIELPLVGAGLYSYYGYRTPPMTVGGVPLYWLFINAGAPLLAACILLAVPGFFAGARALRVLLLPMTVYAAWCLACGWPIFTALHMPGLSPALGWAAALLTVAIGATVFDSLARWVAARPVDAAEPARARPAPADRVP